jgi:hypothetical protein
MEVNNQPIQGPRPNRRSGSEQPIDITRLNREAIQRSTDDYVQAEYPTTDSIELSDAGQALAAAQAKDTALADESRKAEETRQAKVQELRQQYVEGKLNTPERVEKAAHNMLASD